MMRTSLFFALALALGTAASLVPVDAAAQSAREVRASAEASMVLTGSIEVTAEGAVSGLVLDQRASLSAPIAALVEDTIRSWRFEPTLQDGKAVATRSPMRVRLRGTQMVEGSMQVRIASVDFSEYDPEATDVVTNLRIVAPRYPKAALSMGGQGEAMLLLKIDRTGAVVDAIAEQVNMTVAGSGPAMDRLRGILAKASIAAARKWTFRPPTTGADAQRDSWTVRVPVRYALGDQRTDEAASYGRWQAFIPGPRQTAPWRTQEDAAEAGSDLLPAGGVYMVDGTKRGLRLLTPLAQG